MWICSKRLTYVGGGEEEEAIAQSALQDNRQVLNELAQINIGRGCSVFGLALYASSAHLCPTNALPPSLASCTEQIRTTR
ncbi:hypothetical protein Mapa_005393 [Marchantia paleacea]|nr:hypothetical protein Mapa_005393 [Marchantia paleacea]